MDGINALTVQGLDCKVSLKREIGLRQWVQIVVFTSLGHDVEELL